ncbi:MAG: hypothetical protein ACK6A5_01845 [Flavobacteriales bacterium]
MKRKIIVLVLVLFTGLNVFLALNRHSHSKPHSYHGELWADRGGYFVYLPAATYYSFDARKLPGGLDTLTGRGFKLDTLSGRVITKYTAGVAMLQSPFYLLGHGLAKLSGWTTAPYGPLDHVLVDIAASTLLSLGLLLLFLNLRQRYGEQLSGWLLLAIYAGSNLYFYTIGDPGMSHVYSFFLFSLLLFLVDRWYQRPDRSLTLVCIGITAGLILLVRPTNAVFLIISPFVNATDLRTGWRRIASHISAKRVVLLLLPAALVWLPQLLYWHYAFGSAITWPYVDEGFTNWAAPEFARFWFAPNNGLFTYTPLYVLVILAAVVAWVHKDLVTACTSLAAFLAISYLGSSWWVWHFGCGFGSRTMVEYLALFAFPLASWTRWSIQRWGRWLPAMTYILLAAYNLKLVYSYGNCWFFDEWDWQAFGHLLFGPTK